MPIPLNCPHCGKHHQVPEALAGRQAKCGCGAVLAIPAKAKTPAGAWAGGSSQGGGWQAQARPTPTPPPAASLLDELSSSDRERPHRQALERDFIPASSLPAAPLPTAAGGIAASEYIAKAQSEIATRRQAEAEALPQSVTFVVGGLGVSGVLSLAAAFGAMLFLGSNLAEEFGTELVALVMVAHGFLAVVNITAAVLIYLRIPFSRPLGYFAATVNLCGGPVHFITAIMVLFFLSTSETAEYVRRRGAPGAIDW